MDRLAQVFQRLADAGLKLKPGKCCFAQAVVKFLGHIVSADGVATDPEKLRRVQEWPQPKNVSDLRSFLGLTGYYRRFIEHYAAKAAPLTDLTSKRKRFCWTETQDDAFCKLTEELCSPPVLQYPIFDPDRPFILKTDASDIAAGAVLCQRQDDKGEYAIAYASRKFNPAEQNYPAHERELSAVVWAMKHFRPYLYGQRFLVLTDNEPITYLKTMKDPRGRLARWLQEISSFDFEISYKSGKLHKDADALSRHPEHRTSSPVTVAATSITSDSDHVCTAQQEDENISKVLQQLASGKRPPFQGEWRSGVLGAFRRVWHQLQMQDGILIRKDSSGKMKTVVPHSLVQEVLSQAHDNPTAGHLGVDKTASTIRERFYWPGYVRAVEEFVETCETCQRRKNQVAIAKAPLQPIPVSGPFDMIAMDFLELPATDRGNKYCLVITDYFTRWPEAFPVPDQHATTVARILVDGIVSRHGVPLKLHSDQGRSFENQVIRELCKMLNIQKTRTTPYHPQSDGLVERMNRTLLEMLAKYTQSDPTTWDIWLPTLLFAYRAAEQPSTGFSPFKLLYGREPVLPIDLDYSLPRLARFQDAREYLEEVQKHQRLAVELCEEHFTAAQGCQRRNYPARPTNTFNVGDQVLLHNPAVRRGPGYKLSSPWTGPFVILDCIGQTNFRIRPTNGQQRSKVVHYNRMKPFHSRHDSGSLSATETDTDSSESNVPSINGTNRDESLSDTDLDDSGELFLSDAGAERNESPAPEDFFLTQTQPGDTLGELEDGHVDSMIFFCINFFFWVPCQVSLSSLKRDDETYHFRKGIL